MSTEPPVAKRSNTWLIVLIVALVLALCGLPTLVCGGILLMHKFASPHAPVSPESEPGPEKDRDSGKGSKHDR